jgi:hypothetical protein
LKQGQANLVAAKSRKYKSFRMGYGGNTMPFVPKAVSHSRWIREGLEEGVKDE